MQGGDGIRCWRQANANWRSYDKILITRMQVTLKAGQVKSIDPADLKALLDYFHGALVEGSQAAIPDRRQAGTRRAGDTRRAHDLTPTQVTDSLIGTATPYGFVAEIGSGAATGLPGGATPYLGETGIETQLRDGATNAVIAECEDTEVGRKYAADLNAGASGAGNGVGQRLPELVQQLAVREGRLRQMGGIDGEGLAALRAS